MSFNPTNELVFNRNLKVVRLSIPFVITHNATAASVILQNDEAGFVFLKSAGVDQITPALQSGEVATYTTSPVDATGTFNILVRINEYINKVCDAEIVDRVNGGTLACALGSATGVTVLNGGIGQAIMLTGKTSVNFTTTDLNGCLNVEYITQETVAAI